jgi:hypothetical protein
VLRARSFRSVKDTVDFGSKGSLFPITNTILVAGLVGVAELSTVVAE